MIENSDSVLGNPEEKSLARKRIVESIRNIDVSDFDPSDWTSEHIIRPLPGAQERFLTSKAQVTFYGGRHSATFRSNASK